MHQRSKAMPSECHVVSAIGRWTRLALRVKGLAASSGLDGESGEETEDEETVLNFIAISRLVHASSGCEFMAHSGSEESQLVGRFLIDFSPLGSSPVQCGLKRTLPLECVQGTKQRPPQDFPSVADCRTLAGS